MNPALPLSVSPRIAPLFRLQYEAAQEAWVLLYPEGMVRLNTPAAEILRRCDGQRDVAAIIADLEQCFQQSGLAGDVQAFLGHAGERGWLV
ncbi:pyrroloquinoline quinone biosynthesis peptide chaperone PqqD [Ideonella dechloratans]|uniref:pyrroloquinoline quinone biosynthesis peptide chaperone PqqD n=1 Tax=Ideonella dechloratans TaxID=36863 RepID=UPI0035AFBD2A